MLVAIEELSLSLILAECYEVTSGWKKDSY